MNSVGYVQSFIPDLMEKAREFCPKFVDAQNIFRACANRVSMAANPADCFNLKNLSDEPSKLTQEICNNRMLNENQMSRLNQVLNKIIGTASFTECSQKLDGLSLNCTTQDKLQTLTIQPNFSEIEGYSLHVEKNVFEAAVSKAFTKETIKVIFPDHDVVKTIDKVNWSCIGKGCIGSPQDSKDAAFPLLVAACAAAFFSLMASGIYKAYKISPEYKVAITNIKANQADPQAAEKVQAFMRSLLLITLSGGMGVAYSLIAYNTWQNS